MVYAWFSHPKTALLGVGVTSLVALATIPLSLTVFSASGFLLLPVMEGYLAYQLVYKNLETAYSFSTNYLPIAKASIQMMPELMKMVN